MSELAQTGSGQEQAIRQFLRDHANMPKGGHGLGELLAKAGQYYGADRAYILKLNTEQTHASIAWEWRRDGVRPERDTLQKLPVSKAARWFAETEAAGAVFIASLSDAGDYPFPVAQGTQSLMAAPLVAQGKGIGLLGVDNPRSGTGDLLLLSVMASVCCGETACRSERAPESSENDPVDRMQIIQSLSEIYTCVYYIDLAANRFTELSSLSAVHEHIGATGNARERLTYFCHHMVMPEYTEEMLSFVELSTLDERLRHTRIISKPYQSTLFGAPGDASWGQCSFIACDRDTEGRMAHVIFATQAIQEAKIRELEAQKQLQQTNRELTTLLEAEKQHSSIISALSGVFFALYYIDLTENAFQELLGQDQSKVADARHSLQTSLETRITPAYRPAMRIFMNLDTMDARLADKKIITQEYISLSGGWTRCSFIPVEKDQDGKITKILCGLRRIAAEKEATRVQDNVILALSMSYDNVYVLDMNSGEAVCYRMGKTMRDRYGQKFAAGNYERNIRSYIENDVLEEDRHLFDKLRFVSGIKTQLAKKQTHYFNYRVSRNGKIQYFQCQLIKPSRKMSEVILGFKNIDEEKQLELAQQKKIEDALAAVEKINAALQEEMAIAAALSRDFPDVLMLDLENDSAFCIKRNGDMIADKESMPRLLYHRIWDRYISEYVLEEDKANLAAAVSASAVQRALDQSDEYVCSYRARYEGSEIHHFQAAFYRVYSQRTAKSQIIAGFRNVDAIVEEERKQASQLEAQSEIIEGLGSEYYSVLLVDPLTDTVTTFRAEDEDGRSIEEHFRRHNGCWSKGIRSYSEELVSEQSRGEFMEKLSLDRIRSGGEDYSLTYEKLTDSGIIYLQARVSFVPEKNGGFVVVIGTRNVDDLIKKERQQEMALQAAYDAAEAASRAKSNFLSNMSHDIRTPMNGIIGMTAIATTHIDDKERVQDCLQKITQASKHLLSLINEVLDMSKIESGKVELNEEEFNLSDLIDNLLSMTSSQIEEHHHQFTVNLSGLTHEAVIGDSLRIQKIFTNLMGNAVKFTPDGGEIRLTISEKPSNQAKVGCYEFVFEDNGIGMREDFLARIFEPFSRAGDSRNRKIQGTGLGMAISRSIVRLMGGDIKVESTLGVGSRFTVTMYLKLQDTVETKYDHFADLNVLVADDDALSLESCCTMLNDFGMNADGVSTGAAAVERVTLRHEQGRDYSACIIDWKMPDMDGIATTRAIRKAVGNELPIIILSAYDWSDIEQEARAAGANAFISKPLFRSKLAKTFGALTEDDAYRESETPLTELQRLDLTGRRVLVVEDNELNAEIAIEMLQMTGLTVEHAEDGKEAVDRVAQSADGYYDLIFMDIQMPKMNGYDATRAIRAISRNYCKQIPIIAMTANAFAEDVQAAKTVGMNEHIAKPLDWNILTRALRRWLLQ